MSDGMGSSEWVNDAGRSDHPWSNDARPADGETKTTALDASGAPARQPGEAVIPRATAGPDHYPELLLAFLVPPPIFGPAEVE